MSPYGTERLFVKILWKTAPCILSGFLKDSCRDSLGLSCLSMAKSVGSDGELAGAQLMKKY